MNEISVQKQVVKVQQILSMQIRMHMRKQNTMFEGERTNKNVGDVGVTEMTIEYINENNKNNARKYFITNGFIRIEFAKIANSETQFESEVTLVLFAKRIIGEANILSVQIRMHADMIVKVQSRVT